MMFKVHVRQVSTGSDFITFQENKRSSTGIS